MPRATSKGETANTREMVERFALSNGTAVQIHWPSEIDPSEGGALRDWLQLIGTKMMARVAIEARVDWPEAGTYGQVGHVPVPMPAPEQPLDWKTQRERTKDALGDRIVELPKDYSAGSASWDMPAGTKLCGVEEVPPPPQLRKYFTGCQCAECVSAYGVPGTQVLSAGDEGYDEHMSAIGCIGLSSDPEMFF